MSLDAKKATETEPAHDPLWIFRYGPGNPEHLLDDVWPYIDRTPEERDRDRQMVCRVAIDQWRALSPDVRERVKWFDAWEKRSGMEILARWAREYRERTAE